MVELMQLDWRLKNVAERNGHSYVNSFEITSEGITIKTIIGGKIYGLLVDTPIYPYRYTECVKSHFRTVDTEYSKSISLIPKDFFK